MSIFNGRRLPHAAYAVATEIQRETGLWHLPETFAVSGTTKTLLRKLYTEAGGRRGGGLADPTAAQYRALYNGEISAPALFFIVNPGQKDEDVPEGPKVPARLTVEPEGDDPAQALAKVLAAAMAPKGPVVNEEAIRAMATAAIDGKVLEIMAAVPALVAEAVENATTRVTIQIGQMPEIKVDQAHFMLPKIAAGLAYDPIIIAPVVKGSYGHLTFRDMGIIPNPLRTMTGGTEGVLLLQIRPILKVPGHQTTIPM